MNPIYTRKGRIILRNGIPVLYLARSGNSHSGYALSPAEADSYAHAIVDLMNACSGTLDALRRGYLTSET